MALSAVPGCFLTTKHGSKLNYFWEISVYGKVSERIRVVLVTIKPSQGLGRQVPEPEIEKGHASDQWQEVCLRNSVINESDTLFFCYLNSNIINLIAFPWVKTTCIEMLIPERYTGKNFVIGCYYKYNILWIITLLRKY